MRHLTQPGYRYALRQQLTHCKNVLTIRRGNLYIEMARNILSDLKTEILYRIDVNFQINEK